jgi:DnaJ-class molecular chaperone
MEAKPRDARVFVDRKDMNGLYPIDGWCLKCHNHSGFVFPTKGSSCGVCHGRGCTGDRFSGDLHCSVCLGSGFLLSDDHRCSNCINGTKKVLIHVKFTIDENAKSNDVVHEMAYPEHGYEKITFILK